MASIRYPSNTFFFAKNLAATLAAAKPGDEIVFEPGVYAEAVAIDKPLTLRGAGARADVVLAGGVKVGAAGPVTLRNLTLACESGAGLEATATQGLRVTDVTLRNGKASGLTLNAVVDAQVESCRFEGNQATAFEATGSTGVLRNCAFAANQSSSVVIAGGKFDVEACEISAAQMNAIYYKAQASGEISNCTFAAGVSEYPAVCATEKSRLALAKCQFRDLAVIGVYVTQSAHATIEACVFKACAERAVFLDQRASVLLRHSQFGPLSAIALDADGQGVASVADCEFHDCGDESASVRVHSGARATLTKCRFEACRPILARTGGVAKLEACGLRGSTRGLEACGANSRCEASATTFETTMQNAAYAYEGGVVAMRDCRIWGGSDGDYPSVLARGGGVELVDCRIDSDAQACLNARERGRVVLQSCTLVHRSGVPIGIDEEGTTLTMKGGLVEGVIEAVAVTNGAMVEIDATQLKNAHADYGVLGVNGATVVARNLRIEDTVGYGVVAISGAKLRLERSSIARTAKSAISINGEGTRLDVEALTISHAKEAGVLVGTGASLHGRALVIEDSALRGLSTAPNAGVDLRESRLAGSGEDQIFLEAGASCTLSDMRFERGAANFAAIVANGATLRLSSSTLADNSGAGVVVLQGGGATVEDCTFSHCAGDGVRAVGESTSVALSRCKFSGGGDTAAFVKEAARLDATSCEFSGGESKYPQVVVGENAVALLTDCAFQGSPAGDLRAVRNGALTATNCTLLGSKGLAVEVAGAALRLAGCRIEAPLGKAVGGSGGAWLELESVEIQGAADAEGAVGVEGASQLKMGRTLIVGAVGTGVIVRSGAKVDAEHCAVNGAGQYGFLVEGADSQLQASHCNVHDCGADGVRAIEGATASLSQGEISYGRRAGVSADAAKLTLTDTVVRDQGGAGILVEGGGLAEIADGLVERVGEAAAQSTGQGSQIALLRTRLFGRGEAVVVASEGGAVVAQSCLIEAGGVAVASGGTARVEGSVVKGADGPLFRAVSGGGLDVEASRLLFDAGRKGAAVVASGAGVRVALRGLAFHGAGVEMSDAAHLLARDCDFLGSAPGGEPVSFEAAVGEVVDCRFRNLAGSALAALGASTVAVTRSSIWNRWGSEPALRIGAGASVSVTGGWIQNGAGPTQTGWADYQDCALGEAPPAALAPPSSGAAVATALIEIDALGLPPRASLALYALAAALTPDPDDPSRDPGVLLLTGADDDLRSATARAAAALYLGYGLIRAEHVVVAQPLSGDPEAWVADLMRRGHGGAILADGSEPALDDLARRLGESGDAVLILSRPADGFEPLFAAAPALGALTRRRLAL